MLRTLILVMMLELWQGAKVSSSKHKLIDSLHEIHRPYEGCKLKAIQS